MANSEIPAITAQDGYVNDAYEDGLQKSDKVNDKLVYKLNRLKQTDTPTPLQTNNNIADIFLGFFFFYYKK